jgi:5-methylcytosine-specific restriction protein A
MRNELLRIAAEFTAEAAKNIADNTLAAFIRHDAPSAVNRVVDSLFGFGFKVVGSPGQGNWARIPWIAVFNPAITTTATRGYYAVYLFSADMARLYLTLNQGTTAIEQEFKSRYLPELERRAQLGNARLGKLPSGMSKTAIDLASSGTLPDGYEAGHVCGYSYDLTNLPSEAVLAQHLGEVLGIYLKLDTLGGLTDLPTADDDDAIEGDSVDERRRYRQHRSIERNPSTSRKVKKALGYVCQGCSFDFEKVYGEIGHQYIEAHHLIQLGNLPPNTVVPMNVKTDFAVLCANCHRMMHRKNGPATLADLKAVHKLPALIELFNGK